MSKTKEMKYLCDFAIKVYRVNKDTSANKKRLEKSVKMTVFIFKAGTALLIATAILTCIKPAISYLLMGKLEPIIPSYIPGINEEEPTGYACTAVFHFYILFVFVIGTAATDLGLMALVIHSYTMSHIFRNAVNEFNSLVAKNEGNTNTGHIRASLNNLILMHIEFIK